MSPLSDIILKRAAGFVRVNLVSHSNEPLTATLRRLGLGIDETADRSLREIRRSEAKNTLVSVLTTDMAYSTEVMPRNEAAALVDRFLDMFPGEETRFLTNVAQLEDSGHSSSWSSMTISTFDGGVVCISTSIAGCIWVEDED